MSYILGRDPETNEIMVGDSRTNTFFLRGLAQEEQAIRDLVQAANDRLRKPVDKDTMTPGAGLFLGEGKEEQK